MIKKTLLVLLFIILVPIVISLVFSKFSFANDNKETRTVSNSRISNSSEVYSDSQTTFDGLNYVQQGFDLYLADSNLNRVDPSPYNDTEGYVVNNFDEIVNNNLQNSYRFYSVDESENIDINQGYEYFLDDIEYAVYDDPNTGLTYYEN